MSLARDLRATVIDHAALAVHQTMSGGERNPDRLAEAAVAAAAPFLMDAKLVENALAAREPELNRQPPTTASLLWQRAEGNEAHYLDLMQEACLLRLTTVRSIGAAVDSP